MTAPSYEEIFLPVFGITITVDTNGGGGTITTNLGPGFDQLESMLLAMACAGVDLQTNEMYEAIETVVDASGNHEEE